MGVPVEMGQRRDVADSQRRQRASALVDRRDPPRFSALCDHVRPTASTSSANSPTGTKIVTSPLAGGYRAQRRRRGQTTVPPDPPTRNVTHIAGMSR